MKRAGIFFRLKFAISSTHSSVNKPGHILRDRGSFQILSTNKTMTKHRSMPLTAAAFAAALAFTACNKTPSDSAGGKPGAAATIQNIGSDTMVNLAQAW